MKYLKMLGLAAVAAMAVMAFIGASSASATVLCEGTPTAGNDCASVVPATTNLNFTVEAGTSALLKGPFGETIATCTESTSAGPIGNAGSTSTTVSGNITTLSFSSCNRSVTVALPGSLEVHHISGTDNGTVTSSGATVIIHSVPLFGECQYSTNNTDIGTLKGNSVTGGHPTFEIKATITSENGCPKGTWSGSYESTEATNWNVAAG